MALPEGMYDKDKSNGKFVRNNYMIMSTNYYTCSLLKPIGIECIPSFHMAHPWYRELPQKCGGTHILCQKNDYEVESFIGFSAAHYMLHTMCSQELHTKKLE